MDNQPKNNNEDELENVFTQNNSTESESKPNDNTVDEYLNLDSPATDEEDTDKYLAIEQPGVQFTDNTNPTRNSDQIDYSNEGQGDEWSEEGGNSKNSDAFNQDDYILEDNVDLDEDQNQSISSDDEDFEESNERYTN